MLSLARKLRTENFEVKCFTYNTVTGTLAASAMKLSVFVEKDATSVTLIGHSLGGLVSISAAQHIAPEVLHSVVLLGSPYQGSKAANVLRKLTGSSKALVGNALHDWAEFKEKPTVSVPVLTIAGSSSTGLGRWVCGFKEDNDGTVTVAETHYPGAESHILKVSHTGMLFNNEVAKTVATWLKSLKYSSR